MPHIEVYLHFVWTTKNRIPFLCHPEIRKQVWLHIIDNGKRKGIHVIASGGHNDHCHCLVSMTSKQTISELAQLIKGESSFWINKSGLIIPFFQMQKFDWQNDYDVASVSPKSVAYVVNYLLTQETHDMNKSLNDELNTLFPTR